MNDLKIIIFGVIILIFLIIFMQYNYLVELKSKVKQSKSGIDIYCKQRFDLIPNLVETVKSYINYEKETLEKIIELKNMYNETKDLKLSEKINNKINHILALSETYPNLKASEQFLNLQKKLGKMESQLQAARRIYNSDVTEYNIRIETIPYNILAKAFGFKRENLFEIENQEERENIDVEKV